MKNANIRRAAQKTEGQAGGLHKKVVRQAAEKDGQLNVQLNVQPSGLL